MYCRVTAALLAVIMCTGCHSGAGSSIVKQRYDESVVKVRLPLAAEQYERGEYEAAAESALKVIEADPASAQAHLIYAKSLLAVGNYAQADDHFSTAIDLNPLLDEAWYGRALAADQAGDRPAAISAMEKVIELNPSNIDAIIQLADIYVSAGEGEKALAFLNGSMKTDVRVMKAAAAVYSAIGRTDEAVRLYERLCLDNPKDMRLAETLGYMYIEAGLQTDAAEIFEMLCKQVPENASVYFPIAASCYSRAKNYAGVIRICDKYASLGKNNAAFWITMGQAAIGINDVPRAIYCAKRAISIAPDDDDAKTLMGCAQYMDGRCEDALRIFEQLCNTSDPFVWVMKARCLYKLGKIEQATAALNYARQLDPESEAAAKLTAEFATLQSK